MNAKPIPGAATRRDFLLRSAATLAAAPLLGARAEAAFTGGSPRDSAIKIGLVGCGGRGTGAAFQALKADERAVLWAVADVFADPIEASLKNLADEDDGAVAKKIDVGERRFTGFDAYRKLIASGVDVVLLATPTVFRPEHLRACVEAGKHVFCEKPVAVDAPGCRSVLRSTEIAAEKGLSIMSGFCWRRSAAERAVYGEIVKGRIGEVRASYNWYFSTPGRTAPRKEGWSELEFQLRNWYHFVALGGDMIVEQSCHSVDKMLWAMGDVAPVRAVGVGGRATSDDEVFGDSYDHFSITYEWASGARGFLLSRQYPNAFYENKDHVYGTEGEASVDGWGGVHKIVGKNPWTYEGPKNDMYQQELDELLAAIVAGKPVNDGERMTRSTLASILGRTAAYTGKSVTWDAVWNSEEDLAPKSWSFEASPPAKRRVPGRKAER